MSPDLRENLGLWRWCSSCRSNPPSRLYVYPVTRHGGHFPPLEIERSLRQPQLLKRWLSSEAVCGGEKTDWLPFAPAPAAVRGVRSSVMCHRRRGLILWWHRSLIASSQAKPWRPLNLIIASLSHASHHRFWVFFFFANLTVVIVGKVKKTTCSGCI